MSARNAFATTQRSDSGHEDGERPTKRTRLTGPNSAATWIRCTQEETSLEVDIMILDYVIYRAIKSCLDSRDLRQRATPNSVKDHLQLVDSFMPIFKARHSRYQSDAELRLRMLVLKLVTLFTQRLTLNPTTPDAASLRALRDANRQRAQEWRSNVGLPISLSAGVPSDKDEHPITHQSLEHNRKHVLSELNIPAEDEDYEDAFYGTASCVSLLDLLPLFMQVSAASLAVNGGTITRHWMNQAATFMLQACLEQYLVFGARGIAAVHEASAWGYVDHDPDDKPGSAARHADEHGTDINDIFEDAEHAEEEEGWVAAKEQHIGKLAVEGETIHEAMRWLDASHLEAVAAANPIAEFELSILGFLDALSLSIQEPVLAQLEKGSLDGMTREETQDFLRDCGVQMTASQY